MERATLRLAIARLEQRRLHARVERDAQFSLPRLPGETDAMGKERIEIFEERLAALDREIAELELRLSAK
jgi:hypothetical protein